MDRKSTIECLIKIGEELAEEYGYTETILLKNDYAKEYKWVKANDSGVEENIHFRFCYTNPSLSIKQPGEVLCEIVLSDYDSSAGRNTGEFDIGQIIVWKIEGLQLQKKLLDKWYEKCV